MLRSTATVMIAILVVSSMVLVNLPAIAVPLRKVREGVGHDAPNPFGINSIVVAGCQFFVAVTLAGVSATITT